MSSGSCRSAGTQKVREQFAILNSQHGASHAVRADFRLEAHSRMGQGRRLVVRPTQQANRSRDVVTVRGRIPVSTSSKRVSLATVPHQPIWIEIKTEIQTSKGASSSHRVKTHSKNENVRWIKKRKPLKSGLAKQRGRTATMQRSLWDLLASKDR
jgi:hypothetical protein